MVHGGSWWMVYVSSHSEKTLNVRCPESSKNDATILAKTSRML